MFRDRISASVAVIGPTKRPSKFSGLKAPKEVGASFSTVSG
jgi:hypothetical protein